jgi:hypothetical protein
MAKKKNGDARTLSSRERRTVLRRLGRFAAVSAPAVTLLLAAQSKPAGAVTNSNSCRAAPVP